MQQLIVRNLRVRIQNHVSQTDLDHVVPRAILSTLVTNKARPAPPPAPQ